MEALVRLAPWFVAFSLLVLANPLMAGLATASQDGTHFYLIYARQQAPCRSRAETQPFGNPVIIG